MLEECPWADQEVPCFFPFIAIVLSCYNVCQCSNCATLGVLAVMLMNIPVFWGMTPCIRVYSVYLKCLHELGGWVLHIKTENSHINICPEIEIEKLHSTIRTLKLYCNWHNTLTVHVPSWILLSCYGLSSHSSQQILKIFSIWISARMGMSHYGLSHYIRDPGRLRMVNRHEECIGVMSFHFNWNRTHFGS
jgi:hypothetical protein